MCYYVIIKGNIQRNRKMNNPIMTRIDDNLLKLLNEFCKEKHWKPSQAVREIVAQFFKYELSETSG
jgi:hypothetical protein